MDRRRRTSGTMDAEAAAARFAELFPELYLRLHPRRDRNATTVTPQMWAMLTHLAMAGPLTVGECARHFERAQSVVSETLDALEKKGLLERTPDVRDRRRTLVWLTDAGHAHLRRARRVLDEARLTRAMNRLAAPERRRLIEALTALVGACQKETKK